MGSQPSSFRHHIEFIGGHSNVWVLLNDPVSFRELVHALGEPFRGQITKVAGVESRGFLLGAAVAYALGVGFVPIRNETGLFPGPKSTATSQSDYRGNQHVLRIQRASLNDGDRVVLVDDWIETGSQARAAKELVEGCGATWVGISTIVNQAAPETLAVLARAHALVQAGELPDV